MSIVFLYAGQGSQRVGMGKDIYEKFDVYRSFIDGLKLDIPLLKLMHEGPEDELTKTEHTQPAMAAFAAGVTQVLADNGIRPDAACGLSLGEYGALYAGGVFDAKDYVKLVEYRGRVMAEAAEGLKCSMSAVLGVADSSVIEETVADYDGEGYIAAVNFNCPGQTVICGDEEAVTAVEGLLKEKGAKRCIRLKVSGPFHTKYMAGAGDKLKDYFEKIEWKRPSIPVAVNVTGGFLKDEDIIPELLVKQVQSPVRLENDLRTLIEAGYDNFVEIGPGNTMSGFLKKTARAMKADVNISGIDTAEDLEKIIVGGING